MKCIYCDSRSYGKGCIFSPTNTHVHMDSPDRCIYCNSKYVGSGCIYNPYGKNHVKSPEFLNRVHEQTKKSCVLSYLYEKLKGFSTSKQFTPLSRFYKRLSEIISNSGEPLLEAFELQSKPTFSSLNKEQYVEANNIKKRLIEQYQEISKTINRANTFLPNEIVEEILIDAIIDSCERKKS
jgi:hypothetical protein